MKTPSKFATFNDMNDDRKLLILEEMDIKTLALMGSVNEDINQLSWSNWQTTCTSENMDTKKWKYCLQGFI